MITAGWGRGCGRGGGRRGARRGGWGRAAQPEGTGRRPVARVRLLTVVVVVALVAGSATVLLPVLGWLVDLL